MEEITTLPAIQPVMPKIEKQEFNFQWNHEEVKEYLISATGKYAGLVVTDENLKDMEKAKREITSIRTAIQKFQIRGKSELRKPVNVFDEQCKELLKVVNAVEAPLKEQLDKYETVRRDKLIAQISREYAAKATAVGLLEKYWQLDIDEKWLNKTAKWSETCVSIDHLIASQKEFQAADSAKAELIDSRKEIRDLCIEKANIKYNLASPINADDVLNDTEIVDASVSEIKARIEAFARNRKEVEERARLAKEEVNQEEEVPTIDEKEGVQKKTDIIVTFHCRNDTEIQTVNEAINLIDGISFDMKVEVKQ